MALLNRFDCATAQQNIGARLREPRRTLDYNKSRVYNSLRAFFEPGCGCGTIASGSASPEWVYGTKLGPAASTRADGGQAGHPVM